MDGGAIRGSLAEDRGPAPAAAIDVLVLSGDDAGAHCAGAGALWPAKRHTGPRAQAPGRQDGLGTVGPLGADHSRDVAAIVRGPSAPKEEVRPWTPEKAERFLEAAAGDRLYALFAVGVALGLRRGELLGLRWSDVDLDVPILRVRQSVQRIHKIGLVTGPPTSSRSRRDIPLPAFAVRVLREHRLKQAEERLALGPYWVNSGLVFTSSVGTPYEPRNLARNLDELQREADVRRIRFHDMRHTCASLLLAQGVPTRVVMDVLGHSQFSITMDLYSHVMPSALMEAAQAMDRALGGPSNGSGGRSK